MRLCDTITMDDEFKYGVGVYWMIDFILYDDNLNHSRTLSHHLTNVAAQKKEEMQIAYIAKDVEDITDCIENASNAQRNQRIYFLDIMLESSVRGIDLCEIVNRCDPSAYVVYVSAYPEHAMECICSHAFDFIVKPYTFERLNACVDAILRQIALCQVIYPLNIRIGSRIRQLDQREILFIEAKREYVVARMRDGEMVTWRESISKLPERLNAEWFARVHRSYLINQLLVKEVDLRAREIIFPGDIAVHMSAAALRSFSMKKEQNA